MARPSGGGLQWSDWVTDIVLEMLSHRTPPESIPANILAVGRLISPNYNIVESVPSINFVRNCRSVLAVETKTLGAAKIAGAVKVLEHHSDDTSRRGVSFGNSILRIATETGYENVALSSAIFAADGTAESGVAAVQRTFREARDLLQNWRDVTRRLFPDNPELLDQLPDPIKLTLARLAAGGWLMTDTCNTAQKFRRLLREIIEAEGKEAGMTPDEINVYEADCWHHLRNVWIGAVVLKLGKHLAEVLSKDLDAIPFMLRVTTDVTNLGMATEKYFGIQANYVKVTKPVK